MLTNERVANQYQVRVRRLFYQSWRELRESVSVYNLEQAIRTGDVRRVYDWTKFRNDLFARLKAVYTDILEASAIAHTPRNLAKTADPVPIPRPAPQFAFGFDLTNPEAVRWIELHAAEMVTIYDQSAKEAIRALVLRSFEEGIPPIRLATYIREHIGLLSPDSRSPWSSAVVDRFAESLEGQVAEGVITEVRAGELTETYRNRLIRSRANNIARTETMTASNQGQQQLWQQMEAQGYIDKTNVRRKWLVTRDDRLCRICAPIPTIEGNLVRLDQPFITPVGKRMNPPAHPSCRCSTRLVYPGKDGKFPEPDKMPAGWTQTDGGWVPPKRLKPKPLKPRARPRRKPKVSP